MDFEYVDGPSEVEYLTYAILLYDDIQYLGYKHDNIVPFFKFTLKMKKSFEKKPNKSIDRIFLYTPTQSCWTLWTS